MTKRKLLVKSATPITFPSDLKKLVFEVDHDYIIRNDGTQARLRKRGQNGQWSYSLTVRYPAIHGQRLELKRNLNRRQYTDLFLLKDPSRHTIRKFRTSFLYNDQYFELDQFVSPHAGLVLLEFYTKKDADWKVIVPDFIPIEGEVTPNPEYSMYNLALIPDGISPANPVRRHSGSAHYNPLHLSDSNNSSSAASPQSFPMKYISAPVSVAQSPLNLGLQHPQATSQTKQLSEGMMKLDLAQ